MHNSIKPKRLLLSLVPVGIMASGTFFTLNIIGELLSREKDIIRIAVWLFFLAVYFLMNYTGKTDRFRSMLFILIAVCFPVDFIARLFELRGHLMTVTFEDTILGHVPFCHIAIPQTLVTAAGTGQILFPGMMDKLGEFSYGIGMMIITWLGATLMIGRGWCGWACFFGGWEDGFSRVRKKPLIKKIPQKLIFLPFALLLVIVLVSTVSLSPAYCNWGCPFRAVSEFLEVSSPLVIIQTVIFFALFLGLVVVLPILTRKRTQCAFLCPFGAMQSVIGKINPFYVKIDKDKCSGCGKCIQACPVMAIDTHSLEEGKVKITCVKCGRCIDNCPEKAIGMHIKGTPFTSFTSGLAKNIFNYLGFFLMATIGSDFIINALHRLGDMVL